MGDVADDARAREEDAYLGFVMKHGMTPEQAYAAGIVDKNFEPVQQADQFDEPDSFDSAGDADPEPTVKKNDPLRPEAKRGRYYLPNPDSGANTSWQRVTNHTKLTDDTYHLELWKQRNVAKGIAMMILDGRITAQQLSKMDVKEDRDRLNKIVEAALDKAEAYKNADEGTALHTSSELANHAGGDLNKVPTHHRPKIRMYLDALAAHGLRVVPGMIERVTVSMRYGVAGKFDLIVQLPDGSYAIADLKTGDSLDLALPGIAAQLEAYEDGVNTHGVWDGQRFDDSIKVRDDIGVIIWLPSTQDHVEIVPIDLNEGRRVNAGNMTVKATRKIKAKNVTLPLSALAAPSADELYAYWIEQLNAAWSRDELIEVAKRARYFGQWTERLAGQARVLASAIGNNEKRMGS